MWTFLIHLSISNVTSSVSAVDALNILLWDEQMNWCRVQNWRFRDYLFFGTLHETYLTSRAMRLIREY
jgi:predicted double-glycine peptidase